MAQVVKKQYVSRADEWVEVPIGGGSAATGPVVQGWVSAPSPTIGGALVTYPAPFADAGVAISATVNGTNPVWCTVHTVTAVSFMVQYWGSSGEISGGPTLTNFVCVGT